ncbi:hypothetical protein, partial [Salmonella sp. s51228]|uniref:hypothetical protein n=1 Tax=Salmonella sp. s51228 TaxID=3159652 RepID=UPI0039815E17
KMEASSNTGEKLSEKVERLREKKQKLIEGNEDRQNQVEIFDDDLKTADTTNEELAAQVEELKRELSEVDIYKQSLTSSTTTTSGAGGILKSQVDIRYSTLEKRKVELNESEETLAG